MPESDPETPEGPLIVAGEGVYECPASMNGAYPGLPRRLRGLSKQGSRFIAREPDGTWGVAASSLDSLRRIYREDPYEAFYEIVARPMVDRRLTPDLELRRVP